MNVLIEVDMEGISGVINPEQVKLNGARYEETRKYMAWDANACIEGCFRGGATHVTVWDAHGRGFNIPWDLVDGRVDLRQGGNGALGRMHDIGKYDALILLGFHAMAGTRAAVLEHTMSTETWQNFWINGRKAGEIAIDAGIAGDAGVPVIMVSGDDKTCAEARDWIKGVHTAQVKTGYSSFGGKLLSKAAAHQLLTDTAEAACRQYRKIKPLVHARPVRMRLELVERNSAPAPERHKSYLRVIDERTYEVSGPTTRETFRRL